VVFKGAGFLAGPTFQNSNNKVYMTKEVIIVAVIMAAIIGTPTCYCLSRHTPSQWEMAVQKVAQDGDTSNPLFEEMRQFDSIATVNSYDIYDDSFMDKWKTFHRAYLSKHPDLSGQSYAAAERWQSGMWQFAYDYSGTSSQGLFSFILVLRQKDVHAVPVSWWHRRLAPLN
jgi:hypothetical protein